MTRQEIIDRLRENAAALRARGVAYAILAIGAGLSTAAYAAQATDEVFANAALRSLHDLARAVARYQQATKDSDQFGCRDEYMSMQKVAHEALIDMHSMSFAPVDAVENVSALLRVSQLQQNGCSSPGDFAAWSLLLMAGQAVIALRYDYSIGDSEWYPSTPGVNVNNPIRYAESLRGQSYSWVNVRPKDMYLIVESDWKAELASRDVDDPSIENSGTNLKAVEVDYRKNPDDGNTTVYFYRTKEDAQAAIQAASQQAAAEAKADAKLKADKAGWKKKLTSLPYMLEDHNVGFKLVYAVCRDTGKKTANGASTCSYDGSHDWSDSHGAPYHWFSDVQSCEDGQLSIFKRKPDDVTIDEDHEVFVSGCVPAPKINGHVVTGYEMVFALVPPGAEISDASYAELRQPGSNTAAIFKAFEPCYDAMDTVYNKFQNDIGVDEDGTILNDDTKSIQITGNCVRVY